MLLSDEAQDWIAPSELLEMMNDPRFERKKQVSKAMIKLNLSRWHRIFIPNLKTAKALSVKISDNLLSLADGVIE